MKVKSESEVAQSYPTLSDIIDCSLPGSSVHGIFQARILEWGAIAFSMTNLDNILKSRDITWLTNVCLVKAMVFPVVMYGYESWTIQKAECRRIDASGSAEAHSPVAVVTHKVNTKCNNVTHPTPVLLPGISH